MRATRRALGITAAAGALLFAGEAGAQTPAPTVVDPRSFEVVPVADGPQSQPVQMEFINDTDFFVLEKPTGQVKLVKGGGAPTVVLDLTVNSNSERGLLGISARQVLPPQRLRLPLLERDDAGGGQRRR